MFPSISDKDFLEEIYYKKEYYINKLVPSYSCDITDTELEYQAHQRFIRNYINPNTPYKNLLVMWGTGVGKTLGAIAIAETFRPYIQEIREKSNETPEIFIISKDEARNNFYNELFSPLINPPYITPQEREKLNSLKISTNKQKYKDFKKELLDRVKKQGFYRFMGSTKFVNQVLGTTVVTEGANKKNKLRKKMSTQIKNNNNGIIIIDEAHSMDENDIIEALIKIKKNSTNLKIILLTATPMINKAREIISMLNILTDTNINYNDIFVPNSEFDDIKPNGLKIIANVSRGYVSYMSGHNPYTFPKKIEMGTIIPPFKYTKLIPVEMSKLQANTYKHFIVDKNVQISNIGGARGILDMVLPSPFTDSPQYGIYERADIDQLMASASHAWLQKHDIQVKKSEEIITGPFLKSPNLKLYSPKFDKILHDIIHTFNPHSGPVLVYNDQITGVGLKIFAQILIENGIDHYNIHKTQEANQKTFNDDSICVICAATHARHTNSHEFIPAKFIFLHGEIQPQERDKYISLINTLTNEHGQIIKIVLGSKITAESIDFKRLRGIFITNFQDNISTINQIIGRAIRHCSHTNLPDSQRNVEIYKYVSMLPHNKPTFEFDKYLNNEKKHENILKIENVLKANSIDCSLYSSNTNHCYWNPPKHPKKVSDKTYDLYFYEDEINFNEKQIRNLFYKDIIWTYEQLKKEILPLSPLAEEKYLAIALERLISNKTIILNRFNDPGYIIYNSAYLFQPLNSKNEQLSLLDRFIPIKQNITQQVSLTAYLDTLKKAKEEVFNLSTFIHKIQNYDIIKFSNIVSKLHINDQAKVLEYGMIHNNKLILTYYKPFILTEKQLTDSGYTVSTSSLGSSNASQNAPIKYIAHVLLKQPICLYDPETNKWEKCFKNVAKKPKIVPENDIIIGFMDKNKNKMVFKLRPPNVGNRKLDKRTVHRGFICSQTNNKNELLKIANKLDLHLAKAPINKICQSIENELKKREYDNKGKIKWFYEYIELI